MKTANRSFSTLAAPLALAAMLASPLPALAQDGEVIGESGRWTAFRAGSDDNLVCFITSQPTKFEGNYDRDPGVRDTPRPRGR